MGSYTLSCFASHQIISPFEKVRIIPVIPSKSFDPSLVSTNGQQIAAYGVTSQEYSVFAYWSPISGALSALYDDGGMFKLNRDIPAKKDVYLFFEYLFRNVVDSVSSSRGDKAFDFKASIKSKSESLFNILEQATQVGYSGENPLFLVRDISYFELEECFNCVQEAIWDNLLFVKNRFNDQVYPVRFSVVCEVAYFQLISMIETDEDTADKWNRKGLILNALDTADRICLNNNATISADEFESNHLGPYVLTVVNLLFKVNGEDIGSRHLNDCRTFILGVKQGTMLKEDLVDAISSMLQDTLFYNALMFLHVPVSPIIIANQDYDNSRGIKYANLVAKISQEVSRNNKYQNYGNPKKVSIVIYAKNLSDFDLISEHFKENDGYFDKLSVDIFDPSSEYVTVVCETPFEFGDVLDILRYFDEFELPDLDKHLINLD